jgi:hypothetical protein
MMLFFKQTLGPLLASVASVLQIAEFVNTRLTSSTCCCNVFMNGCTLYFIISHMKWYEVFVPHLVPPEAAELLLYYILVFLPTFTKLRVVRGEETALLYSEYLWVANCRHIASQVSPLLSEFTGKYCGAKLMMQPHYRIQVELFHVFLSSTAELEKEDDDLLELSCGHHPLLGGDSTQWSKGTSPVCDLLGGTGWH